MSSSSVLLNDDISMLNRQSARMEMLGAISLTMMLGRGLSVGEKMGSQVFATRTDFKT